MQPIQIVPGDPARLEEYVDVFRESALYDHYYAPDETVLRDILADALARGAILTAQDSSGKALGVMQCEWHGMFGAWPYLALLGVHRSVRGSGVGRTLIQTFEKCARKMQARQMFICVSHFNPRARALYQSCGFRFVTRIPDLYRDGVTELVLKKRL